MGDFNNEAGNEGEITTCGLWSCFPGIIMEAFAKCVYVYVL